MRKQISVTLPPEMHELINTFQKYLEQHLNHKRPNVESKSSVIRDLIKLGLMFAINEIANGEFITPEQLDKMYNESFLGLYHDLYESGVIPDESEYLFISRCESLMRESEQDDQVNP
jgi:hypothetical protein